MNYDAIITEMSETTKADKTITQPWRNYALKALAEYQAFVRMGKTTTNRQPDDLPPMEFAGPDWKCICTELGKRKDCPVHGSNG